MYFNVYFLCIFFKNIIISRHVKLEIALAIPASNEGKIEPNNSAAQELAENCMQIG